MKTVDLPGMSDRGAEDRIIVAGHDLVNELMGRISFPEMIGLLVTGEIPTAGERLLIDALLVTFADHGVTPSSLAARLTLLGAPESFQAAVAAGIAGAGSRYLGTLEKAATVLSAATAEHPDWEVDRLAHLVVAEAHEQRRYLPGLGHPEHKHGDPRVPRLLRLVEESGCDDLHLRLLQAVGRSFNERTGLDLPVNAAGVGGAIVCDLGWPPAAANGLALVARSAGLVGQLLDEQAHPRAQAIWDGLRHEEEIGAEAVPGRTTKDKEER